MLTTARLMLVKAADGQNVLHGRLNTPHAELFKPGVGGRRHDSKGHAD